MKKLLTILLIAGLEFLFYTTSVHADTATDNAFTYLKTQQDATGQITNGFSAPSEWSAIAFSVNGTDITTVKNPTNSLYDFLLTDIPGNSATATDWESRILAIVAAGYNPTDFGGVNYVEHLESFYNNNQLGDTCSLNDDIFGLIAEIAAGNTANAQIKQDVLNFLIQKQDSIDGGFSYSAPGCNFYGTSADITGAAAVALAEAKNHGLSATGLNNAIASVSAYLANNQNSDGGFGYFGSSDTDTTGWVLQGLNALGLSNSTAATSARNYLLSQQSNTDGGIMDFNYGTNAFASNATTTAQALIGLLGKDWLIKVFDSSSLTPTPSISISPTPTITPTLAPTDTPTPTPTIVYVTNTVTNTITNTVYITPTPQQPIYQTTENYLATTPSPKRDVLGTSLTNSQPQTIVKEVQGFSISSLFLGMGIAFLGFYGVNIAEKVLKKH